MPQNATNDKSTLVQVLCRRAVSHCLSYCWLRCILPYGVTIPQYAVMCHNISWSILFDFGTFNERWEIYKRKRNIKRKPPCIGGMELVSLSCNRVFISAESVGRGWCKFAIATKGYQFHATDKCGFLFMPWITDKYTFVGYTKLVY